MFLNIDQQKPEVLAAKDCDGRSITYGELCSEVLTLKDVVPNRSVIFCFCQNNIGSLLGYLSFVEGNAVPLLLSSNIDDDLMNNLFSIYTPSYIWAPSDLIGRFQYHVLLQKYGYSLMETGEENYPVHENLQILMTTSGSTGSPKLVRYKKGNLEANAKNVARAFGWTSEERPICDLAMHYTMGLNVINTHLYVGATLLLITHNLMSGDYWDFVKQEAATNFTGVPFSYDVIKRLHIERMELPALTTFAEGGGKLTDERFQEMAVYARDKGKRFIATFGTTETAARMSLLPAEMSTEKVGSIGHAIPEGELFLIDSQGNALTDLEAEGELCYRGPNVTMGYADCKQDLQKGDEWEGEYHTGDLAKRDADGYYYITGRISRFLKLLSYRVSLDQCEQLIQENFHLECACTGTDERMEIYITDSALKKEVQTFICNKTGLYKDLFQVYVIEHIPRNDTGKIQYNKLSHG